VRFIKAYALVVAVVLAGVLAAASSGESKSSTTGTPPAVRLKTITSRATSAGTSLIIEASDPVPYVATRPDPLTLYIDFRNVSVDGLASFASKSNGPISNIEVEPGDAANGGSPRVRVNLSQAVASAPIATPSSSTSTRRRPCRAACRSGVGLQVGGRRDDVDGDQQSEAMQALVMSNRWRTRRRARPQRAEPRAQIGPG
jgi:hypothetical protein